MVVSKGKKSEKQLANEKSKRILEGVAYWCSYYRHNPQRFVREYLNVNLKTFQKILIYAMMHNNHFMFWASRGLGKTWLTALFCVVRCILFPKTKICIASSTRTQANEVLSKITDDFMKNYGWGSDNLKREISYYTVGTNKAVIDFHNGSWIKVITAGDTGRGNRANILITDEFRMVDKDTIDTVLKRFLSSPRQPNYLNLPEYKNNPDLLESNIEIYMSSCWFKSHWSFDKSKAYTVNLLGGRKGYFVCGLPYQIAIKEGLLKRVDVEDEMSEIDFDSVKFDMEMGCLPFGDTDGAFFTFDDISQRRKLQTALYPPSILCNNRNLKIPDLLHNERRILSVDVALMASKKTKNDASSIMINSAIPTNNNNYTSNLVYLENHEGLNTDELALIIRRLFYWYKCTDLVIDTNGVGLGVFDALIQDMIDPETGELYQALSCCNDKIMAERCKVDNAPKVIWSIKASAAFNNEACILLRSGFQKGKINLLVSEFESEEILKEKIKGFNKMPAYEQIQYKMPFIQTTLLVYELISLEHEIKGTNIKITEKTGMRKDRYSSLAYNYWVQCQLERELLHKPKTGFDASDYASKLRKLNKKPRTY
ncbi:MAG: terminase family protein [Bacteroidales bacterium]|nr:terminase family protein [Bacteroidales bacterium]